MVKFNETPCEIISIGALPIDSYDIAGAVRNCFRFFFLLAGVCRRGAAISYPTHSSRTWIMVVGRGDAWASGDMSHIAS